MPWVTRGIRNGQLTSRWPKHPDEYFDSFPAAVDAEPVAGEPDRELLAGAVEHCPTNAITADPIAADAITPDRLEIRLDRGRCILCGRCVREAPALFGWQHGAAVAALAPERLVVGSVPETEENLAQVRAALAARVKQLRRSAHIRHVDAGSGGAEEWEAQALVNPVYDIHRLGLFFTASPRHADILLVTGIGTASMVEPLRQTREAMPDPVVVIAAGTDAISGGLIGRGYTQGSGVADVLDVDVWVPGDPPSPFSLLHALLLALGRVDHGLQEI